MYIKQGRILANDFAAVLLFLLGVLVKVETRGLPRAPHVRPGHDVPVGSHHRMPPDVAVNSLVTLAVRDVLENGRELANAENLLCLCRISGVDVYSLYY